MRATPESQRASAPTRIRASDRIPRSIPQEDSMAQATSANQKKIIGNQKSIMARQDKIMGNQMKILANQKRILGNQKRIMGR
jgi:hypothetical protein